MSSFGAIGEWIFLSLVSQALLCLDAIQVEIWFALLKESSSELSVLLLAVADTGIDPRRQLLRRFSSIYFDDKVDDVRSEALDVLWMEAWGTGSCSFTKFWSLSSSRWVDVLVSPAAGAAGRRRARTRQQGLGCGCNFLFFEGPCCKRAMYLMYSASI